MTTNTLTPVVVATHADNVVRLYYRGADGALNQTGQLVANTIEPTSLATLAADLSDAFGWAPAATPVKAVKAPPKAIEPKPAKTKPKRTRVTPAESAQRRANVVRFLTDHGDASVPEMATAVFAHERDPENVCRGVVDQMVREGLAIRGPKVTHGVAIRFSLPVGVTDAGSTLAEPS